MLDTIRELGCSELKDLVPAARELWLGAGTAHVKPDG